MVGWVSAQETPPALEGDLKALQGDWVLAKMEADGKIVPPERLEGTKLTIKGADYQLKVKDRSFVVTLKINEKKDPKELDMIPSDGANKDKVHPGIYKLDGDTLLISRGLTPDHARPTEFATWPDTGYFVATWKRIVK